MIRIQFDSYNFIGNVEFESRIGSLEIAGASKSAFASSQLTSMWRVYGLSGWA